MRGLVIAGVVLFLFFVSYLSKTSEPTSRPRPPARRVKRPLDPTQVSIFVTNVRLLLQLRQTGATAEGELEEVGKTSRDQALQAYEALVESKQRTPAAIRTELQQRVLSTVVGDHALAARNLLRELFAAVDKDPVLDPLEPLLDDPELRAKERERRRVAALYAALKDPEAREHVEAPKAPPRRDLPPGKASELRRVAELLESGKDRNHPEVVQHLNAAAAYEAAEDRGLSWEQRRELHRAAALLAAGKDRTDPEVLKHVNASAAYGAATREDLSPDQRSELRQAAVLIAEGKDRDDPEVRRHVDAAAAYRAAERSGLSWEQRNELRQVAELIAGGKDPNDPELRRRVDAVTTEQRAAERSLTAELLSAHFVVAVCALAEERDRDGAPDRMAAARANYEKLLLVAGMSEVDLQQSLVRRVLERVPRPGPAAERIMQEIFAKERR